jgi:hypothetical protein
MPTHNLFVSCKTVSGLLHWVPGTHQRFELAERRVCFPSMTAYEQRRCCEVLTAHTGVARLSPSTNDARTHINNHTRIAWPSLQLRV